MHENYPLDDSAASYTTRESILQRYLGELAKRAPKETAEWQPANWSTNQPICPGARPMLSYEYVPFTIPDNLGDSPLVYGVLFSRRYYIDSQLPIRSRSIIRGLVETHFAAHPLVSLPENNGYEWAAPESPLHELRFTTVRYAVFRAWTKSNDVTALARETRSFTAGHDDIAAEDVAEQRLALSWAERALQAMEYS